MKNSANETICLVCLFFGWVAPWFLLVSAALISVVSESVYWGTTAAYMSVFALILLTLSYFVVRIVNRSAGS